MVIQLRKNGENDQKIRLILQRSVTQCLKSQECVEGAGFYFNYASEKSTQARVYSDFTKKHEFHDSANRSMIFLCFS